MDPITDTAYRRQQQELTPDTPTRGTLSQLWVMGAGLVVATATICGFVQTLKYDIKDSQRTQAETAIAVKDLQVTMGKVTDQTRTETQLIRAESVQKADQLQRQMDTKLDVNYLYRFGSKNPTLVIPDPK